MATKSDTICAWRPGRSAERRTHAELVRDFLLYTECLPREEVARIAGVGAATLRKWELGLLRSLRRETRRRLLGYLARRDRESRVASSPARAPTTGC